MNLFFDFVFTLLIAFLVWNHYKKHKSDPSVKYKTFPPRFWAPSIDMLIFWPLFNLVPLVMNQLNLGVITTVIYGMINLSFYIYTIYFNWKFGGTYGKIYCKIKIVRNDNEKSISLKQAILRDCVPVAAYLIFFFLSFLSGVFGGLQLPSYVVIVAFIPLLWFLAEIITMLSNEKRRALHDYIAGTVVIRADLENSQTEEPNKTLEEISSGSASRNSSV